MQKKIIALAVAGLVSGAAFAQSTVTIDGIMDMGYQYSWGAAAGSTKSLGEVKSVVDGSRIGFHGVEDLGNGLKVGFDATAGFDIDTGKTYGQNGAIYSEGSSVNISGNFGKVQAGYFSSSLDSDISGIDVSQRHAYLGADLLIGTGKLANHVAYISPDMSGFKVIAGYSSNANGNNQDAAPTQTLAYQSATGINIRAYDIGAIYKNGPIAVGAGYIGYRPQNNSSASVVTANAAGVLVATPTTDAGNANEWQAGASYNFGPAAVSLYYAAQNQDVNAPMWVPNMDNSKTWALGLAVPFTPADVLTVSYADKKIEYYNSTLNPDQKVHALGFFYAHNLSKRTALYAMYGNVGGDNSAKFLINSNYDNAVSFGLHHTF